MNAAFVGTHFDEEVAAGNGATSRTHLRTARLSSALTSPTRLGIAGIANNLNMNLIGVDVLATYRHMG